MKRFVLAALLLASACAVGPRYQRPEVPVPQEYRDAPAGKDATSLADLPWWEVFRDPELAALLEEAIRNNLDLKRAAARVQQARALVGVSSADFWPQIGAALGASYGQQSAKNYVPGLGPTGAFNASLGLSWEIDLWGRIRNATDAAKADLLATEEFRRGVLITLVADVANAWLDLRELDQEVEIARKNSVARQANLDLFKKRADGGIGNDLEVSRARGELAITAAVIPGAQRFIALRENQLSVLLGRLPGPIARSPGKQPLPPPDLPAGVPASLLERRPDVKAAEDGVMAATYRVGVAVANRLPKLDLAGLIGLAGPTLGTTFSAAGFLWNAGGGLLAPIFEGGRLASLEAASRAELEQAAATYQQAVLNGYREVSDAAISIRKLAEVRAEQSVQVDSARTAERLANRRFEGGVSSYLEVLDAQTAVFQAELEFARTQRDEAQSFVQLYRALGGGWQEPAAEAARPAAAPTAPAPAAPEKG
jgi:multidrug efflux system outer membrane protein